MPSTTASSRSRVIEQLCRCGRSASVTGCSGLPSNIWSIWVRHQASLTRASEGSVHSSTTSSTSRQKAYSAVIARRRSGGRNRNE